MCGLETMKLTRYIIFSWWHQFIIPEELLTNITMWDTKEGLLELNTKWGIQKYMSFWYALNHEWYKMNNVKYAYTGCALQYQEPDDEIFED
jgi:hypothetical protein